MGNFSVDLLAEQVPDWFSGKYTTGVETGTLHGQGTYDMSNVFFMVETMEIDKALHTEAHQVLAQVAPNVSAHLGHSVSILSSLVHTIDEPTVFYLDAHWAGNRLVDWSQSSFKGYGVDTGFQRVHSAEAWPSSSQQQVPLLDEVKLICSDFKPACVLFLNDMDKFDTETGQGLKDKGFKGEDWSHLSLVRLEACWARRLLKVFKGPFQWVVTLSALGEEPPV